VEILKEYPSLEVLSIEPIREAFIELESQTAIFANWRCLNVALGDAVGTGVMHVANNDEQSSSLLEPEFHLEHYPTVQFTRTQETRIITLDSLQIDEDEKVYLKLDIQGHELSALMGGSNLLSKVVVIELEMSPIEMYSSQATFLDIANFLRESGFKIFTFADIFRDDNGKWTYVDVIFSR
jgi:FkbM family methyltransferase